MADFAFYTGVYLGSAIPENAFPSLAQRAREVLSRMQRIYRVTIPGEDSLNMAICAMAEVLYTDSKRQKGVAAATLGEVSVRYDSQGRKLQGELYEKAGIYLDISRGVGV